MECTSFIAGIVLTRTSSMVKPNIKLMYYISKMSGLISFQINKRSGFVEETKQSFFYFVIFGAFIQGLSILAFHHLYFGLQSSFYNESVRVLVMKWELVFLLFKSLTSYCLGLFYHNDTIELINEFISFEKTLTKVSPLHQDFFDNILMRQYIVRCVAFIVQAVISLSSFIFFDYEMSKLGDNLGWTVTIFNHLSALIIPSMFFYGGLILSSRFLRILNDNLEAYISSTTRNVQCIDDCTVTSTTEAATLHLDQFRLFFRKFCIITDKVFYIYGFQIMLTLMVSAGFTLSSVRVFTNKRLWLIKLKMLEDFLHFQHDTRSTNRFKRSTRTKWNRNN